MHQTGNGLEVNMATIENRNFIDECKKYVELDEREYLQGLLQTALKGGGEQAIDWAYTFQKVYLHSCLKKRAEIADWLEKEVFVLLDPLQQIALRQTFAYGRHLLRQKLTR